MTTAVVCSASVCTVCVCVGGRGGKCGGFILLFISGRPMSERKQRNGCTEREKMGRLYEKRKIQEFLELKEDLYTWFHNAMSFVIMLSYKLIHAHRIW